MSTNYAKYVGQNVTISGSVALAGVGSFQLQGVQGTRTILSSEALQRGEVITVVCMLLVCVVCALLFEEGTRVRILLLFAFGIGAHYALDGLWIHVSGGLMLLHPLSCDTWQLQLVRPERLLQLTADV